MATYQRTDVYASIKSARLWLKSQRATTATQETIDSYEKTADWRTPAVRSTLTA